MNRKITGGLEMVLLVGAIFSFAYLLRVDDENFVEGGGSGSWFLKKIIEKLLTPIFALSSATEVNTTLDDGSILSDRTEVYSYNISSSDFGAGCCALTKSGEKCATSVVESCDEDAIFLEGALCVSTSFCRKGCCYNEDFGIYDKNVLGSDCKVRWIADPNCNLPGAKLGCCVLGGETIFETRGQCETESEIRGVGVDWRSSVGEGQCVLLSSTQRKGACVSRGRDCEFVSEGECFSLKGEFNEGTLCTSEILETDCEMTTETSCVDGKDGVYFVDSCGNPANVYDSSRVYDDSYWNVVIPTGSSCDEGNGNAESESCGNCNRFLGGICDSAVGDNFDVDYGNFYCKPTSCMFKGVEYGNGESWCVYDGAVGDGNDVVGSRHWKYVCSQGVVTIEPCADYRNQICVQTNTFDVVPVRDGSNWVGSEKIEFRNAACIANNWRACINLNSEDDGAEKCEETLNCRIEKVAIADHFKFDVCVPKYPAGFSFTDERYQKTAEQICAMANQKCTVVRAPKTWGGCEIVANKGCLTGVFADEMNDFCRSLGDCGGSANIVGKYSENYKIIGAPKLGGNIISNLVFLSRPVVGQYAEVENYSEYLEAAGVWSGPEVAPSGEDDEEILNFNEIGMGASGIGTAVYFLAGGEILAHTMTMPLFAESLIPFGGAMIGAGIGMIAGAYLAKEMGLTPGGSLLMAIGGGMSGGAVGLWFMNPLWWNPALFWAGVILIIVSFFFGEDDCDDIVVKFECETWQALSGGDDCGKCNGDLLKPCSEYRCGSLGAACVLINKGSDDELCVDENPDDVRPPILSPMDGVGLNGEIYRSVSDSGFKIVSSDGECLDAYTPLVLGIESDEPSQCRFDVVENEFENMAYDFGNAYLYNHTTTFVLPDPSHGQSRGGNWTGDLSFYVKCRDTHGHETPRFYVVDMCVKEGPDKTAPLIRVVSPLDNSIVSFDISMKDVSVITNELAECRWDVSDSDYSLMMNSMSCDDDLGNPSSVAGYECRDVLPVGDGENVYYIRCRDQSWLGESDERNANSEGFVYRLRKPSLKIVIDSVLPNEDFDIDSEMTTIELSIKTSGGGDFHKCSFSFSGYERMIEMFETGGSSHRQSLNRPAGRSLIYVECGDETGDFARDLVDFEIVHDTSSPEVARVWQSEGSLHVLTNEDAECKYSNTGCMFSWDDGKDAGNKESHVIDVVRGKTYYVKCEDEFGNVPSGCSVVVFVS